ncbi:ankyrin repeat domain-containing protein, partial [Candidatus Proelusimicrobium excrementi]|uniref:ankyrin repeat domain-containing protein n=1 Tax=Candidatus Proelusimicrobium excrementi TaxID=3416222 RepID=UPI003D0A2FFA
MKKLSALKIIIVLLTLTAITFSACDTYKPNITMLEAVNAGNKKAVKYYLKQGEMVNQKDEDGTPLIALASKQGSLPVVKLLIKAGAEVNAKSKDGFTALMFASGTGHTEVVTALISAGADVNA